MTLDEWTALQATLIAVYSPLLFAWAVLLIASTMAVIVIVVAAFILKGRF